MVKHTNKVINQKDFWNQVGDYAAGDVSSFAKRSYNRMKKEGVERVLELGCGLGFDATFFAKKGLYVIALDFAAIAIGETKGLVEDENFEENLVCRVKDITKHWSKTVYPAKSVDAVFANKSLHYFPEAITNNILKNIHHVLTPKGLLFACVHSALNKYADKGEKLEKGLYVHEDKIRRFFTMPCLKKYLNGGFDIVKLDYSEEGKKTDRSFLEVVARKK